MSALPASIARLSMVKPLSFEKSNDQIVDSQTGSVWNIHGVATDGELAGTQLEPIIHANHFWFAWAAFKPETIIYEG